MATLLSQKTIGIVNVIRRTWRTNIESQVNQPVVISAHREQLECSEDKTIISQNQNAGVVSRSLMSVISETVTLHDGTELSALQVAEAVELFIEKWDAEDLTPKVVEVPVEEPAPAPDAPPADPAPVPDQGG